MNWTDILGKNQITAYDAGVLLKECATLMESVPAATMIAVKEGVKDAENIVFSFDKLRSRLHEIEIQVATAEEALFKAYDDTYKRVGKKRREIADKINELEPLPRIEIPYNFTTLLEIMERLSGMHPDTFERFEKMAKALAPALLPRDA